LEQIAPGGRFPVEHFPRRKKAGDFAEHEGLVECLKADTPRGGDGFLDRPSAAELEAEVLDPAHERLGTGGVESCVLMKLCERRTGKEGVNRGVEAQESASLGQEVFSRRTEFVQELRMGGVRFEVDRK
jgi:hypothetical protein